MFDILLNKRFRRVVPNQRAGTQIIILFVKYWILDESEKK